MSSSSEQPAKLPVPSGDTQENQDLVVPNFYPDSVQTPDPGYTRYLKFRNDLIALIRTPATDIHKDANDLVDALLEKDLEMPTGILHGVGIALKLTKKAREKGKRRKIYHAVVIALLEKVFDPTLDFKMTSKNIRDTFVSNGLSREDIRDEHIDLIYVRVLEALRSGKLRDLIHEHAIYDYVHKKIEEISFSRSSWELNER
jgi:hypothetical protein